MPTNNNRFGLLKAQSKLYLSKLNEVIVPVYLRLKNFKKLENFLLSCLYLFHIWMRFFTIKPKWENY